jgi:hypothetical protein
MKNDRCSFDVSVIRTESGAAHETIEAELAAYFFRDAGGIVDGARPTIGCNYLL